MLLPMISPCEEHTYFGCVVITGTILFCPV